MALTPKAFTLAPETAFLYDGWDVLRKTIKAPSDVRELLFCPTRENWGRPEAALCWRPASLWLAFRCYLAVWGRELPASTPPPCP